MATLSSILALENSIDRGLRQATVHGVAKSDMTERLSTHEYTHTHTTHTHTHTHASFGITILILPPTTDLPSKDFFASLCPWNISL